MTSHDQCTPGPPSARTPVRLFVEQVDSQWRVRAARRGERMGSGRAIATRGEVSPAACAPSVIEFDGFSVEVTPSFHQVKVSVYSGHLDVRDLPVRVLDCDGRCVDRQFTDPSGSATLRRVRGAPFELKIEWPEDGAAAR